VAMQLTAAFATQLLVVRVVGVGLETDAYIAAQTVPAVLLAVMTAALQSVWLPKLAVLNNDFAEWRTQQSIAQGQTMIMAGGVLLLVWLTSAIWVPILFLGFGDAQLQLTGSLISPLLLAAAFNAQTSLLTIALRARDRFIVAESISMLGTLLSLMLMILLLPRWGIESAAYIAVVRAMIVFFVLLGFAGWPRIKLRAGFACKETWKQMRLILFGASIYKTSPLVDRFWSSQASEGSLTSFSLAQLAIGAIATIMERVISMPLTPALARYVAIEDYAGLRRAYRQAMKRITLATIAFLAVITIAYPVFISFLEIVLKVSPDVAKVIWSIMLLLIGSLHVAVSGSLAVACFYAMGDSKTPVVIGLLGFCLGVFFKSIGFLAYGLPGLAAATSFYYLINILLFDISLTKKCKGKQN